MYRETSPSKYKPKLNIICRLRRSTYIRTYIRAYLPTSLRRERERERERERDREKDGLIVGVCRLSLQ